MSRKQAEYSRRLNALRRKNALLTVLCAAAAVVVLVLLLFPVPGNRINFTPPEFDSQAVPAEPQVPEDLGWSVIRVHEDLSASVCGVLRESEGQVDVWFYLHPDSDCWAKLRMTDAEGNILGQTGMLRPGEYVRAMELDTRPSSDTKVILRIMGYTPETYHSAGSLGLETMLDLPEA